MTFARQDRRLIAWTLYLSVLFGLFACGLHHGQMAGLSLSGLNDGFCTHSGHPLAVDADDSEQSHPVTQFSCPLCSSFANTALLNSLGWNLDYLPDNPTAPIVVRSWAQPPPRLLWPSLNPRASPRHFPAPTQSA